MPKIGLLSDSHGRATTTRRAVEILIEAGAQSLIHLGDIGSLEVIDELVLEKPAAGPAVEVRMTFGNVDWDRVSMKKYAEQLGLLVEDPVGHVSIANPDGNSGKDRSLIYLHGDDAAAMTTALDSEPAYLCHGHSHHTRDDRVGLTRIINPGALFRATSYTVALLDTDTDSLMFYPVE